jgi:hypothetical protein
LADEVKSLLRAGNIKGQDDAVRHGLALTQPVPRVMPKRGNPRALRP